MFFHRRICRRKMLIFVLVFNSFIDCAFLKSIKQETLECKELSQKEKQNMMGELLKELHWSFLISPPFQQSAYKLFNKLSSFPDSSNASETQLSLTPDRSCPTIFQPGINICPWYYVQKTDKNRIPENIIHARCNCKTCSQDSSSILTGICDEVKVDTLIWRRTNDNCEYRKQIEQVTVACACKTI